MPAPLLKIETTPTLPGEVDVVVIGGGIVGVCSAYYLARRGVRVALVEKGYIGAEQSSRNSGQNRLPDTRTLTWTAGHRTGRRRKAGSQPRGHTPQKRSRYNNPDP